MISFTAIRDHLVSAAAAAALLGGGTTLITSHVTNGVQNDRIERLEKLNDNVEGLRKELQLTREDFLRSQIGASHEPRK